MTGSVSAAVNRQEVYLVQTPQTFGSGILKRAYELPYRGAYTDDASVVETSGTPINLIAGEKTNLKITFPEDLAIAEILLKERA